MILFRSETEMKHAEPVNADSSVSIALFLKQCYNTIYNYNFIEYSQEKQFVACQTTIPLSKRGIITADRPNGGSLQMYR